MDLAAESLVAVADAENICRIFTLDKDFTIYRTRLFRVVPSRTETLAFPLPGLYNFEP